MLKEKSGRSEHTTDGRERSVKESYENFIQTIKGKLEHKTPKRKNKNNLGIGGQGKIGNKEKSECVWWRRECDKVMRIRKAKLLKWKYCKREETFFGIQNGGD
jgi:hypothetical protein